MYRFFGKMFYQIEYSGILFLWGVFSLLLFLQVYVYGFKRWLKKFRKLKPKDKSPLKNIKGFFRESFTADSVSCIIIAILFFVGSVYFFISDPDINTSYFPTKSGNLVDAANVLSRYEKHNIDKTIKLNENRFVGQFAFVTVPILPSIHVHGRGGGHWEKVTMAVYASQLAGYWKIGSQNRDDGVMLLWAPKEGQVYIHVGSDVSSFLSAKKCNEIIQTIILPHFKKMEYFEGIHSGIHAIYREIEKYQGETTNAFIRKLSSISWAVLGALLSGMIAVIVFAILIGISFVLSFFSLDPPKKTAMLTRNKRSSKAKVAIQKKTHKKD